MKDLPAGIVRRTSFGLLLLAAVAGSADAQQLDPSRLRPITVPIKDAGVFDWGRKEWVEGPLAQDTSWPPPQPGPLRPIYRNDCTWTGGTYSYSPEHCEDLISQGTIPAPDTPGAPLGALEHQTVTRIEFGYCTTFVTGAVDIVLGFYNNLGGDCAGLSPVRPPRLRGEAAPISPFTGCAPLSTCTAYFDFGTVSGNPLPGSTTNGKQACWTIGLKFAGNGGFCLSSEGDGDWDNDASVDKFAWSFRSQNPKTTYGFGTGPIVAGEPSFGAYGAGTYNLPAGSDGLTGAACGTGRGTDYDHYWVNVDGSSPGVANTIVQATGVRCKGAEPSGSNCYWFGGWPAAPLTAFWMVMESGHDCQGCSNLIEVYCTAGTSADGCRAEIRAMGSSYTHHGDGFYLAASGVQGSKGGTSGLFSSGRAGARRTAGATARATSA